MVGMERFPWGDWKMDNPDRVTDPRLVLLGRWRFDPENGHWMGGYQLRESPIPGTTESQAELWRPGNPISVVRIGPENDWPDTDATSYPKETTLTLYLSRKRWYDCFVDLSVNRLGDPNLPVFVTFLRGDGFRVPKWVVEYRKDSGPYEELLSCDPDGDDHRFVSHKGSVVQKLTEVWSPGASLNSVTDSGSYYVDGTSPEVPVAENGVVTVMLNPYASSEGMMEYQSFVDRTHRYVRVKTAGVWGPWGLVTVS